MSKFVKVQVVGGRKFRGFAYDIGSVVKVSTGGYGYRSWESRSIKLWSPTEGFVFCNPDYMKVVPDADTTEVEADKVKYTESAITNTISWCRSQSEGKDEAEVVRFARNVIAKHSPDLLPAFDSLHPTEKVEKVEKTTEELITDTINWAKTLRTKEGYYRGHYCKGGFAYRPETVLRIAFKALATKGITNRPDFKDIFSKVSLSVLSR